MIHKCCKSSSTLLYRNDKNTGRCRISNELFDKYNIRIGWIVKLLIIIDDYEFNTLCSVWPLNQQNGKDYIYIDDTVFISDDIKNIPWINCTCKVLKTYNPRVCSSVSIQPLDNHTELLHYTKFIGLPIYSKCTIIIDKNIYVINCSNPIDNVSVISTDTLVRFTSFKEKPQDNNSMNASTTSIVEDIIKYVVIPALVPFNAFMKIRGILLLGPPGVGKTFAVKAVQNLCIDLCHVSIVNVSIPDILANDEPIDTLKKLLTIPESINENSRKKLNKNEKLSSLTFFMIDEIDALGTPTSQSDIQASIKQHIFSYYDQQKDLSNLNWCMIATSNRSQDVDPCFRRGGRFEKEIEVMSNRDDRYQLVQTFLHAHQQNPGIPDILKFNRNQLSIISDKITDLTSGYVAADLKLLINETWGSYIANAEPVISKIKFDENLASTIFMNSIEKSMKNIVPSCLRGMITKLTAIKLDDVIGYEDVKVSLKQLLSFSSLDMREKVLRFGLKSPGGALLYGPPGNAKTRLVMAAASHHKLPVISLSAADVYSPYVGDAEAEIRKAFRIARQASPCVLFIDELDALVTNRGISGVIPMLNPEFLLLF